MKLRSKKYCESEEEESGLNDIDEIMVQNNHLYFYGEITKTKALQVNVALRKLEYKHLLKGLELGIEPPPPIMLHINSEGGDCIAGFSITDTIKSLKVPVYSIIEGECASAATFISCVCSKRYITENSTMLIHELRTGYWGKFNELNQEMKNNEKYMKIIKKLYLKYTKIDKDLLEKILKKDIILLPRKCLKWGLVDEIK